MAVNLGVILIAHTFITHFMDHTIQTLYRISFPRISKYQINLFEQLAPDHDQHPVKSRARGTLMRHGHAVSLSVYVQ